MRYQFKNIIIGLIGFIIFLFISQFNCVAQYASYANLFCTITDESRAISTSCANNLNRTYSICTREEINKTYLSTIVITSNSSVWSNTTLSNTDWISHEPNSGVHTNELAFAEGYLRNWSNSFGDNEPFCILLSLTCPTDLQFQYDNILNSYQNLTQFFNVGSIAFNDYGLVEFQFINEIIE